MEHRLVESSGALVYHPPPPVTRTPCHLRLLSLIVAEHLFDKKGANPMPRGGKRPGAGAPKGNRNALRHGGSSQYVQQELMPALADFPELQSWFINYQRAVKRKERDTRQAATQVLASIIALLQLPPDDPMRSTLNALNTAIEDAPKP